MKQLIFILWFSILALRSFGGNPQYPVFLVPDTLIRGANAVLRDATLTLTVHSDNRAELHEYTAVTILNEKGDYHGVFVALYDKQRKVSGVTIRIYDALGNLAEKVKPDEIKDYSAVSGFSLYEDNRMLYFEPEVSTYPYTVVTEYDISYNGIIQFPRWQPQIKKDVAVQHAEFKIRLQKNNDIRWKQRNMPSDPDSTWSGNDLEIRWEVSQLKAFKRVAFMPPMEDITPNVSVAPMEFSYDGYKGSFRSWEDFGLWVRGLLTGRNVVEEETREKLSSMLAGVTDTVEMVRRIYGYVQEQTRYVSIQYGIGGFQPFEASVVDDVGYGDCKALTNYTGALLQSMGIRSNYCIVYAGSRTDDILTDFPSQQFNHAILQVPLSTDTIWLECTNQEKPFGYLGRFTAERTALAIIGSGGKLVRTQCFGGSSDFTSCRSDFNIDEDGNASATVEMTYSGLDYDNVFTIMHEDDESRKKWLYEQLVLPNASLVSYSFTDGPERNPRAVIALGLELEKYAARSGKRLFVPLNPVNAQESIPPSQETRKLDICIRYAINEMDTMTFIIPDGYEVEHIPEPVEITNRFGTYRAEVEQAGDRVIYRRKLTVGKGTYPADSYPDIYNFYKSVVRADHAKLVLKAAE